MTEADEGSEQDPNDCGLRFTNRGAMTPTLLRPQRGTVPLGETTAQDFPAGEQNADLWKVVLDIIPLLPCP